LRRPLGWALGVGTAVYLIGTAVLATSVSRQTLPGLAFSSLDGKTVRLDEFRGKPIVVNLWATWCPPCVREMPVLHEAQEQYPDVHFVFLNQGEHPQQVAAWLSGRRLPVRNVLVDAQRQASYTFNQQGYPSTLFFNAKGELVSVRVGELSRATLEERLGAVTR
jgi:thiol-disulfide isomerase/thioredoxin